MSDATPTETPHNAVKEKVMEIDVFFASFDEWDSWIVQNDYVKRDDYRSDIVSIIKSRGIVEPLTGRVARGDEISITTSLRESILYQGVNSRTRAVMELIRQFSARKDTNGLRIYAPEAITALAMRLRGIYPGFIGSEYTDDENLRKWMYPIPIEDLQNISFRSDTFDIVSTNEVLEHIPSIDLALAEIHRILKPGGAHIGTVPFRFMDRHSERKAAIQDGKLVHLAEAEYHGNPMDPSGGSLVFEIPGWDILERARACGFSSAKMRFVASSRFGYVSEHITGIFVLWLEK